MKRPLTSREAQLFDLVIRGIGKVLAMVFGTAQRSKSQIQISNDQITERLAEIDQLVKLGGPSRLKQALIEADKLLDQVLGELGYQGNLGEKLKAAQNRFNPAVYQAVWAGHKLRNRVVHESSELFSHELKSAIDQIKLAIRELTR